VRRRSLIRFLTPFYFPVACATAKYYRPQPPRFETHERSSMRPCHPSSPPSGYERAINFCWTGPADWGMWNPKPCHSTKEGVVLHELIHHCGETHFYDRGSGAPEACERKCFRGIDPEYHRFKDTPPECACDCTPKAR
jgi:hypothetical protein